MSRAARLEVLAGGPADTEALGRRLAALLRPGDWISLRGSLGAGKTTLVRGLAAGLGVRDTVASPTYLLLHEYAGPQPLLHLDAWFQERLESLLVEGLLERLADPGVVVVVEWADRISSWLPEERFDLLLRVRPEGRLLCLEAIGEGPRTRWPAIRAALAHAGSGGSG